MTRPRLFENDPHQDVALYLARTTLADHDWASHTAIAQALADLQRLPYVGVCGHDTHCASAGRYFVPTGTIVGAQLAASLGIHTQHDLFGGVVPHGFIATKAITHGLVTSESSAPTGWSEKFAHLVAASTLPGFTAFTEVDVMKAFKQLIPLGSVRLKSAHGIAGRGQWVIDSEQALREALAEQDLSALDQHGIVLEQHLNDVETYSVGQVIVGDATATYVGTQSLTKDNAGDSVYGGSHLMVARGGFDALLRLTLSAEQQRAVSQAQAYDAAAAACFPGFMASRRNYDTVGGTDQNGERMSGVLEQSWRLGGATPAELLALKAFAADEQLQWITAATVERYGKAETAEPIPEQAEIYYQGTDSAVGQLTKYAYIDRQG